MIASACLATALPPEVFGVPSSPELGAVILEMLHERWREEQRQAKLAEMRRRL